MAESVLPRRRRYEASLFSADYFIVRGLDRFLVSALAACVAPGRRVVDVGCGEQPLRAEVERLGGVYTGVDVTQNAAGTVDVVASAERVPLADGAFDVVLCTEVLEHVPDAAAAFREIARLARPGGHVVVTLPFVYKFHEEPHDYRRATPHQFRVWAASAGLEVVRLDTLGDEALVLATVWGGMWDQVCSSRNAVIRTAARAVKAVAVGAVNAAASAGSWACGAVLPRKYVLSVASVMRKPETESRT